MLVTSIFSFSHSDFYSIKERSHLFSDVQFILCKCLQLVKSKSLSFGKGVFFKRSLCIMYHILSQLTKTLQQTRTETTQQSSTILHDLIQAAGIVPDNNQESQSGEVTLNLDESQLAALTSVSQGTTPQPKGMICSLLLVFSSLHSSVG